MTHHLERPVVAGDRLAFTEACRYADGTRVLCMATADLDGAGKIARQVAVTAWASSSVTDVKSSALRASPPNVVGSWDADGERRG